jgi:hypothetical protein
LWIHTSISQQFQTERLINGIILRAFRFQIPGLDLKSAH